MHHPDTFKPWWYIIFHVSLFVIVSLCNLSLRNSVIVASSKWSIQLDRWISNKIEKLQLHAVSTEYRISNSDVIQYTFSIILFHCSKFIRITDFNDSSRERLFNDLSKDLIPFLTFATNLFEQSNETTKWWTNVVLEMTWHVEATRRLKYSYELHVESRWENNLSTDSKPSKPSPRAPRFQQAFDRVRVNTFPGINN